MSSYQCLAGSACRAGKTVDGKREPTYTERADTLCDVCHETITKAVAQLPKDWAQLHGAIGDRNRADGPKITSTPTPVILINTRREALMSAIVDVADRAAAVVSDILNTEQPTGRRKPPKDAEIGSLAWQAAEDSRPTDAKTLRAGIAMIEPNIDVLAAAGEQAAYIWKTPRRCQTHRNMIGSAETMLAMTLRMDDFGAASLKQIRAYLRDRLKRAIPDTAIPYRDKLRAAYQAAGSCDDCGAWCQTGQARELTTMTGIDIALELVDLHHQTRAELGETRLRHRYAMPCPRCGGRIGRDDGETIFDCEKCESSWTEREYLFLTRLVVDERQDIALTNYLLAEAYWRLDQIQKRINAARATGDTLALPGSGAIITDAIADALQGHKTPAERAVASDKTTAEQRQDTDDTGQWGERQTAYQPPKPKRKRTRPNRSTMPHISPSSLTTLVDIDESVDTITGLVCTECQLVHAGICG